MRLRPWSMVLLGCAVAGCASGRAPKDAGDGSAGAISDGGPGDAAGNDDSIDAPAPAPRRICDGTDSIRFATKIGVDAGDRMVFTAVLNDLGVDFLYVDGRCRYWVQEPGSTNDPFSAGRAYREGTLSAAQESALHDAVSYDDFARGVTCPDRSGTFDGSTEIVWDGANVYSCYGGFSGVEADWPMRTALYQAATPMKGGVRIMVGRQDAATDFQRYPWPLAQPPSAYETEYTRGLTLGQSVLITSVADVAALRALREQALADTATSAFAGEILLDPSGWALALRDDLPFTRAADGLWEPPPGP